MRLFKKIILPILMLFGVTLPLTSCEGVKAVADAVIAFKTNGDAGNYQESIEEFEIGKNFYTCVKVKIETDTKYEVPYLVQIQVPKTKDVVVDNRGGLDAQEVVEDTVSGITTLNYIVNGKKGAVSKKMLFRGTPYNEGSATIRVNFFEQETGVELEDSYSMTVYFVYGE